MLTGWGCGDQGGEPEGPGTVCDPNPCPTSGVEDEAGSLSLSLRATPNPSTGAIVIEYRLPSATPVTIEVFNAAGMLVRRMVEGPQAPGRHSTTWDGRDERGREMASGVYLARIVTGEGVAIGRAVIAR